MADDMPPNEDCGPALTAISTVLIALVILTSSLRLFVRAHNRNLGWDDLFLAISAAIAIARWGIQVYQTARLDNGKHRAYVSEEDYEANNRLGWGAQLCLFSSICFLKLSIMLLILRIKDDRRLKFVLWGAMAGLVITNGGVIIILLAECKPMGYWRTDAVCWEPKVRIYSIYFTIAYSILTDLLCSLLPLVVVWRVRIPLKTKIMVCGLMSLGLLATGFGIARAASLGLVTDDLTWTYAIAAIWSNIELYLGIVAANLALSRQIYQYLYPNSTRTHAGSYFPRYASNDNGEHSRSAQQLSRKLRDPAGDLGLSARDTCIESSRNRPSLSKSEGSEIPLEPGIRKKTEFWMSDAEDLGDRRGSGAGSAS